MNYIKTTVNLNPEYRNQLNELVKDNLISSVTDGINQAIQLLIKEKKNQQYIKRIVEAAQDISFIERTMMIQKEFDAIETEDFEEW